MNRSIQIAESRIRLAVRKLLREATASRAEMYHNHLDEKDKQSSTIDDLFGGGSGDGADAPEGDSAAPEGDDTQEPDGDKQQSHSSAPDDDAAAMQKSEVSVDDVIDRLNSIRSGRSLKDDNLKAQMEKYVTGLEPAERVALLAFLKGISQIVTGEVPSDQAQDPGNDPADVHMHKDDQPSPEQQKKSVKPNVIKSKAPVAAKKPGAENTSAPVPITPQKRG